MTRRSRGAALEVARIQSEVNRLFETLLRLREGDETSGGWAPAVDMSETGQQVVVEAELPGVDPDTLQISIENAHVVLRGLRPPGAARGRDGVSVLHDEREFGTFERQVPLTTAVNSREAQATLSAGVLRIVLPRVPNRRGQAVPIPFERM